ncbi:MAG TPA: hypothetical protein V6D30_19570 [Leptolyngbyaceae cyanobacterium]
MGCTPTRLYKTVRVFLQKNVDQKIGIQAPPLLRQDFGVQFDKLTVRAATELVEVQSNAQ